jgi:hypothetical protein
MDAWFASVSDNPAAPRAGIVLLRRFLFDRRFTVLPAFMLAPYEGVGRTPVRLPTPKCRASGASGLRSFGRSTHFGAPVCGVDIVQCRLVARDPTLQIVEEASNESHSRSDFSPPRSSMWVRVLPCDRLNSRRLATLTLLSKFQILIPVDFGGRRQWLRS